MRRPRPAGLYRTAVGMVAPLALGCLVWLALTSIQARHDQTRALKALGGISSAQNSQIGDQTLTIGGLQSNIGGLTDQIVALNKTAADQTARIADLQHQLSAAQSQLAAALDRQARLSALVTSEYQQLLARPPTVVMAPASGPATTVKPGTSTTTTTVARTPVTVPPCGPPFGALLHEIGLC